VAEKERQREEETVYVIKLQKTQQKRRPVCSIWEKA